MTALPARAEAVVTLAWGARQWAGQGCMAPITVE
jgi:hypothetical protein